MAPKAQILALSATIKNAKELADWLNAALFISDFRPVKLYEGVSTDSEIRFHGKEGYKIADGEDEGLALHTIGLGKQALFFVATRRSAESLAERISTRTKLHIAKSDQQQLSKLADEIENVLESPTHQCKKLAKCIRGGAAFHHAGLLRKQKSLIEENFRKGVVKIITSTPTLAMGVNLPAWRVVIRDAKRYYPGVGSTYIPVLDYKQMVGRAGRPQYDSFGESILMAKSEEDSYDLEERYINGETEDIISKLSLEPILRTHTLALVASGFCKTKESLLDFFSKTFYAFHYGDMTDIKDKISYTIDMLSDWGFITARNGKLSPTLIGKRVSDLYIDPLTARNFISSLDKASKKQISEFGIIQTINNALEMKPLIGVKSGEQESVQSRIISDYNSILQDIPEEYDYEFDDFLKSIKMTMLFEEWMGESTDEQLLDKYNIAPGEMRGKLQVANWLLYSIHELSMLKRYEEITKYIRKVRVRMMYGVKEELLPLVKLKGIGRVRARKLFNAGLRTIESLKEAQLSRLSVIIGLSVAQSVKNQLEGKQPEEQTTLSKPGK
ncbi:restriction endonuclease subunit R [archaeon]|nr:MAG: restriction endonuclease subunit R [archaeon]